MLVRQPWLAEVSWRLVILDEAQAIRNPGTRQSRAVRKLSAHARIALTGTPVENRLGDLWALFDFLNPGLLGSRAVFQSFVKSLQAREENPFVPLRQLGRPRTSCAASRPTARSSATCRRRRRRTATAT